MEEQEKSQQCKEHNKVREVMCKQCKRFFCPKCIVEHLVNAHKIDLLAHLDAAPALFREQLQKRTEELLMAKRAICEESAKLQKGAEIMEMNSDLDAMFHETVNKLKQVISEAKREKETTHAMLRELTGKVNFLEKEYDLKYLKHEKALKSLEKGETSEFLTSEDIEALANGDLSGDKRELVQITEEVKIVFKKYESNKTNLYEYLQDTKKVVSQLLQTSFKTMIESISGKTDVNKLVENNKELLVAKEELDKFKSEADTIKLHIRGEIENLKFDMLKAKGEIEALERVHLDKKKACEEELKMMEEEAKKMLVEYDKVKAQTSEKHKELEKVEKLLTEKRIIGSLSPLKVSPSLLEEAKHTLVDANVKKKVPPVNDLNSKLVPCDLCQNGSACTITCSFCKKTVCSKCTRTCSHCKTKACEKCMGKCKECYDFTCEKCHNTCTRTSLISLDKNTKYFYLSCEPLGGMKELCAFDLSAKKVIKYHLEIPWENRIIQFSGRVFITGGYKNGNSVADVSEFIEATRTFIPKAPMINPRHTHTLVRIAKTSFAAIGGYTYGQMRECERYDIVDNVWKLMPPLNEAKQLVGCLLIQGKTLYCFGGKRSDGACKTLEKLELNKHNSQWVVVHLVENEAVDGWCPVLYQVSWNEIIILRGRNMPDAYLLDTRENKITKYDKVAPMPEVYTNQLYRIANKIYTVGYYGNVHIFNPKSGEYESIKCDDAK